MALLLIKAVDATHWDPVKDLRGCYKRGDIVTVYDDAKYGRESPAGSGRFVVDAAYLAANPINSLFLLLRVTGILPAQVIKLVSMDTEPTTDPLLPTVVRRRLFRVRLDALPAPIQTALSTQGYAETTFGQLNTFLRNKRTGQDGVVV